MPSNGLTDAQIVDTQEKNEIEDIACEIYIMLIFSAASMSDDEVSKLFLGERSNEELLKNSLNRNDNENVVIIDTYIPRIVYDDDLCGFNKGVVVEKKQIIIDCSSVFGKDDYVIDEVRSVITEAEREIQRITSKYYKNAKNVTLHLATYSFTITEDIANSFLCSLPLTPPHPMIEDNNLSFVFDNPECNTLILREENNLGMTIRNDYVIVYDMIPICQTCNDQELSEQGNKVVRGNVDYNYEIKKNGEIQITSSGSIEEKENDQILSVTPENAVLYGNVIKTHVIVPPPDFGSTWRTYSAGLHGILEGVKDWGGGIALAYGVVAVGCVVAGFFFPPAWAVAPQIFFAAGVMGGISTGATILNSDLYAIDSIYAQDERERQKYLGDRDMELTELALGRIMGTAGRFVGRRVSPIITSRLSNQQRIDLSNALNGEQNRYAETQIRNNNLRINDLQNQNNVIQQRITTLRGENQQLETAIQRLNTQNQQFNSACINYRLQTHFFKKQKLRNVQNIKNHSDTINQNNNEIEQLINQSQQNESVIFRLRTNNINENAVIQKNNNNVINDLSNNSIERALDVPLKKAKEKIIDSEKSLTSGNR